ncbi:MAG: 2-isopropylmalate synthase [Candidatus Omnitrophica bacterium]|nr:2-isopropylmalate synthase [Candidatus Omnitrophota bacterium]
MARRITIFDTTLRDGEQCPGASLTPAEKVEIARQLARLGVDVIEGGFPIASPGDAQAVKLIAQAVKGPVIAALARSLAADIEAAAASLKSAKRRRIHVFLATSPIHRKYKLRKAREEILRQAVWAVKYAKRYSHDVEFSPEDASRTEPAFLHQVIEAVIKAGATTVNIPDTVGFAIPEEFGRLIKGITEEVPNIHRATISVHCHNDLGLSVPNSLAAIANGAGQVECTINGIGERAGNASLEEIVMSLRIRADFYRATTGIDTTQIYKTSRLVSSLTGIVVQPNKAIVGGNAFAHESGIHQDGILKHRQTYEIMRPQDVGVGESKLVLGKLSGRHAFARRLSALGFRLPKDELDRAFARFKVLADKKKEIFDEDLAAIVEDELPAAQEVYKLVYVHITSGSETVPTATIRLSEARSAKEGKILQDSACGDGPVDACYKTINRMTGLSPQLLAYSVHSVTRGKEALGEAMVKLRYRETEVMGRGTSTDIIEASAKAYVNAMNRLLAQTPSRARRSLHP